LRLNISGSAALPTPTKSAWTDLSSGNVLLERYGMTEVGMALSCALDPSTRIDGSVGFPLPSVEVRLVDTETGSIITEDEKDGEVQLRGPTIFKEYWNNPEATEKEFVPADKGDSNQGRWFKTGDVALKRTHPSSSDEDFQPIHCKTNLSKRDEWQPSGPHYHVLGRRSADIIKTGGEKVSALEVERELLSLPNVAEAAVVAVPSRRWGEKVGAVVVLKSDSEQKSSDDKQRKSTWGPMDMRRALKSKLANYKIPQVLKVVDTIERNAMGKSKLACQRSNATTQL
jgi:acyl-CoA synthetase (AMP-forming)/AMP-acid ligase II